MTEKEYNNTLARLVKGAEYLENPLLNEKDRTKGQRLYDELEYKIRAYKEETTDVKFLSNKQIHTQNRAG